MYRPRWWWRWLKCRLGLHGWMMGPYDRDGNVVLGSLKIPYSPERDEWVFESCSFGWPWCKARRITDATTFWSGT